MKAAQRRDLALQDGHGGRGFFCGPTLRIGGQELIGAQQYFT
jgi:hypothetical protein